MATRRPASIEARELTAEHLGRTVTIRTRSLVMVGILDGVHMRSQVELASFTGQEVRRTVAIKVDLYGNNAPIRLRPTDPIEIHGPESELSR